MDEYDIEIDVPSFFVCPISLEIMKDPVTVSTGITYDRHNIEKWLFSGKNNSCPVTKQCLSDDILTPNHTLRRLIQGWCTMNASHGIQRIPTPKPPVTKSQIAKLIKDASKSPHSQLQSLRTLKSIASHSETNRRCIQSSCALPFLASLITSHDVALPDQLEALTLLHNLHVSDSTLKTLVTFTRGQIIHSLTRAMQRGTYESRACAVLLLKSILQVADPDPMLQLFNLAPELFVELVQILKDQISQQATKATLEILIELCGLGRNRNKAVKAGGVWVVVELLLECKERKVCEMMMVVLEMMCGCAEGRAELMRHGAGIAVVSKKILRVSTTANERAVRILHCIAKVSSGSGVVQEMAEVGVVGKLCLMLQTDSGSETKERVKEILKLYAHASRNSAHSCLPGTLLSHLA